MVHTTDLEKLIGLMMNKAGKNNSKKSQHNYKNGKLFVNSITGQVTFVPTLKKKRPKSAPARVTLSPMKLTPLVQGKTWKNLVRQHGK